MLKYSIAANINKFKNVPNIDQDMDHVALV